MTSDVIYLTQEAIYYTYKKSNLKNVLYTFLLLQIPYFTNLQNYIFFSLLGKYQTNQTIFVLERILGYVM